MLLIATIGLYKLLEFEWKWLAHKAIKGLWKRRNDPQYRNSIGFMLGWGLFQNLLLAIAAPAMMYGLVVVGVWYSETRDIWEWTSHPAMALQGRGSFVVEQIVHVVHT